jgi:alkylation response protein AidB-like acyl-CoA dehydrogenase
MSMTADLAALTSFSSPAALEFRAQLRAWLAAALPDNWRASRQQQLGLSEAAQRDISVEWERLIHRDGYAGLTWPREYGGHERGLIAQAIFYEEAALADAPPEANVIGKFLSGPAILHAGTTEQKRRFLRPILAATEFWCEGFSEPGAGSDLASVATVAVRDGSEFRISGSKIWTSNAGTADFCYLLARTGDKDDRHNNLTVFLLDMHSDGIDVRPIRQITGHSRFAQVFFTDVVARESEILGQLNKGWELSTLAGFRRERQPVDGLRRYVQIRSQLDQLIQCTGETHGDTFRVADLETQVSLLRWHIVRTTELMISGGAWLQPAAMLKLYWSELMQAVTTAGLETDCPQHRAYWRHQFLDARASTIYGGPAQIQRNIIADRVLRLPK